MHDGINTDNISIDESNDFVDFNGWRFTAPFRCMNCAKEISIGQFCFGRACGPCDCGPSARELRKGIRFKWNGPFSGPREIIDRNNENFIPEEKWRNPSTGEVEPEPEPTCCPTCKRPY